MIDFKGYTQKAIQTQLLGRVSDKIDRRQGSIIQTALGRLPGIWKACICCCHRYRKMLMQVLQ